MLKNRRILVLALLIALVAAIGAWLYWFRDQAKQFRDMTPAERVAAIRDTGGSPDVDLLLAALKDNDADVRIVAAQHMGKEGWRGEERAAALVVALGDSHPGVRREAAESLCSIGAAAGPALCEALKNRVVAY